MNEGAGWKREIVIVESELSTHDPAGALVAKMGVTLAVAARDVGTRSSVLA